MLHITGEVINIQILLLHHQYKTLRYRQHAVRIQKACAASQPLYVRLSCTDMLGCLAQGQGPRARRKKSTEADAEGKNGLWAPTSFGSQQALGKPPLQGAS